MQSTVLALGWILAIVMAIAPILSFLYAKHTMRHIADPRDRLLDTPDYINVGLFAFVAVSVFFWGTYPVDIGIKIGLAGYAVSLIITMYEHRSHKLRRLQSVIGNGQQDA